MSNNIFNMCSILTSVCIFLCHFGMIFADESQSFSKHEVNMMFKDLKKEVEKEVREMKMEINLLKSGAKPYTFVCFVSTYSMILFLFISEIEILAQRKGIRMS